MIAAVHSFEGTFSAHSGVIKLKDARSITFIPCAKGGARERASPTDMVHTEEEGEGEKANKVFFLSSFSSSSDHKEQLRVWCVQRRVIVLFLFFCFLLLLGAGQLSVPGEHTVDGSTSASVLDHQAQLAQGCVLVQGFGQRPLRLISSGFFL